jgi:hypothetical protein
MAYYFLACIYTLYARQCMYMGSLKEQKQAINITNPLTSLTAFGLLYCTKVQTTE